MLIHFKVQVNYKNQLGTYVFYPSISLFNHDDYRLSGSKAWGWLVKFCIAKFAFDSGQDWIKYDILELVTNFGIEIIQQITLDSIFKLNMFAKYPNLLVNNCDCGIVFFPLCTPLASIGRAFGNLERLMTLDYQLFEFPSSSTCFSIP